MHARRPFALARRVMTSASLQASALSAALGGLFALANLLLARTLSVSDFADVTLAVTAVMLGQTLGPLGQERVVVRHDLPATPALLRRGIASAVLVAVALAMVALLAYDMTPGIVALIVPGAVAGSLTLLASARLQSERRFLLSTMISQGAGLPLLAAAFSALLAGGIDPRSVLVLFVLGLMGLAAWSWAYLLSRPPSATAVPFHWREALAITGISGLAILFFNLERLAIPLLLPGQDLAHFAVLAAIVIAPFRMLQFGVGRTLVPHLRDAATAAERRRLLLHEALLVGGIALLAGVILAFATPWVEAWVLGGKYATPPLLLAVVILAGLGKLFGAFAHAAMQGLASERTIWLGNFVGWACLGLAVVAGIMGAHWGLAGLVAGTTAGAFCQAGLMLCLVTPQLRGR
ncbi:hypothetical protein [Benzoatithermus flavus]